ncbi:hypothetical protein JOD82_002219 [Paenibacillus sp. 1182]|uniref:hypothetical protein n=1 Tax=Paenibacillus sp. 1182 TaxID=2806565 RepID=UPI001AE1DE94|nr:hypothetical protein [Paenibacillus sp. 1182]MBP1309199.1 hypothetical protein [Paenibacillus sp. 1182]
MTLEEVIAVLEAKPFWFSRIHDYTLKGDHVSMLGLFEESMEYLRTLIGEDWIFVERRRNPDNYFLRIDIVKSKSSDKL